MMSVDGMDQNIPLSEMIESLRQELAVAAEWGTDKAIRFEVGKVELEIELAVTRNTTGGGGVKLWVVTAQGEHSMGQVVRHKFKLTLDPQRASGGRLKVADEFEGPPDFG